MTRRHRDLLRLLRGIAAPYGAGITIEQTNGNHWRATFTVGTRSAFVITGSTTRDWRERQEVRAMARRVLRELTQERA